MSSISVELPDHLLDFVEQKARSGGFANAGDYIAALVEAAREQGAAIESALIEGLSSGPSDAWSDEEWQEIRRRVTDRTQEA